MEEAEPGGDGRREHVSEPGDADAERVPGGEKERGPWLLLTQPSAELPLVNVYERLFENMERWTWELMRSWETWGRKSPAALPASTGLPVCRWSRKKRGLQKKLT